MNNLRIRTKLGLIVGILVLCVLAVALAGYLELGVVSRSVSKMVEVTAKKTALAADLRSDIGVTRRMELRTVITPDDAKSKEFAQITRDQTEGVEATYAELSALIDASQSADDRKALDAFYQAWQKYRDIQESTLNLSLENSNVKAHQLTTEEVDRRIREIDEAASAWLRQLDRILAETPVAGDGPRLAAEKTRSAVQRLQVIALDTHRQLNQQVYGTTDKEMDRLEEQIAARVKEAEARLTELASLVPASDLPRLDALTASWNAALPLLGQLQKLLRSDTNSRSTALAASSNEHIDDCVEALVELIGNLRDEMLETMNQVGDTSRFAQWLMVIVPLVCIALSLLLAYLLTQSVTGPLIQGVAFSEAMARGDLTRRLNLEQRDEVGLLTQSLDHVASAFGKIVGEIREVSQNVGGAASELSSVSHQVLAQSEETTAQAGQVASSTEQMATNVTTMAAAAEEMSMNVASISSASEEISVNVGTISSAAEATAGNVTTVAAALQESTQAFEDISHDARDGSQVANRAAGMADGASNTMKELERSAADIGKVTEAIKMIALQTNLLALNATIEATSAGEAGKGFAVVAHEIKELANQSAQAAEDIARKIEGVQSSTRDAVGVIREVQQIIHTLNASSMRISESIDIQSLSAKTSAANLEEASQGVGHIAHSIAEVAKGANDMSRNAGEASTAANDMSRNASEAARAVGDISDNIHGVSHATRESTTSAQQVNAAAQRLANIATQLQQLVGQFQIQH